MKNVVSPPKEGEVWPADRCKYTAFHGDSRPDGPLGAAVDNLAVVEAHVAAEQTNDIPRIMSTVDPNPRFALSNINGAGVFQAVTTYAGVRKYYDESRATFEIMRSLHLKQIATDWYVYYESMATTRPLRMEDGRRVAGEERTGNSVAFFPVSPGGIIGEMPLGRYSAQQMSSGTLQAAKPSLLPEVQARNTQIHDRLLEAMQRGDIPGILARVTDDCLWVTRNYYDGSGPMAAARSKKDLRAFLEMMYRSVDVLGIAIVNRIVADWYVFSELLVRLRQKAPLFGVPTSGATFTIRLAGANPIREDGLFMGQLGWGTDMEQSLRAAIK